MIALQAYDVKLLVKKLEVEVGRPMTEFAASNAVSVILKWVEKSVILSPNKVDDVILALYPALIKFISMKVDLVEFRGEFELEKEFDIKALVEQLKIHGLVVAEESALAIVEVCLKWLAESAKVSENPYDDVIAIVIPVIIAPLNELINGISPVIESKIDLSEEAPQEELALAPIAKKKAKKKVTKKK